MGGKAKWSLLGLIVFLCALWPLLMLAWFFTESGR